MYDCVQSLIVFKCAIPLWIATDGFSEKQAEKIDLFPTVIRVQKGHD